MAAPFLAGALGGGLLGGLAEFFKPQFTMGSPGALENQLSGLAGFGYGQAQNIFSQGAPSSTGVLGGYGSLADLYQSYVTSGGLPSASDVSAGQSFARAQTGQERVNIEQAYQEQLQQARQQAALSGRSVNDPILQARLGRERMQSLERLGAAERGLAAQFTQQLPERRLGFAEGRQSSLAQAFNVQNQLRQQELQNALALGGAGLQGQGQLYGQRFGLAQAQYGSTPNIFGGVLSGLGMGLGSAASIGRFGMLGDIYSRQQEVQ